MAVVLSETVCINTTTRAAVRARKASMATANRTCPPCNGNCSQGRQCPDAAGHTDGDADGLGALRGFATALAIVATVVVVVFGAPIVIGLLSR